jgi:hypothetical protein
MAPRDPGPAAPSAAFYSRLHAALFLSAGLVLAAGLFTLFLFGHPHHPPRGRG